MTNQAVEGRLTNLRCSEGEPWDVPADTKPDDVMDIPMVCRFVPNRAGGQTPAARLTRIGWLDQRGRVWTKIPATADAPDAGSFTPLLVDNRE